MSRYEIEVRKENVIEGYAYFDQGLRPSRGERQVAYMCTGWVVVPGAGAAAIYDTIEAAERDLVTINRGILPGYSLQVVPVME
jgi:hypothetical protein